MYSISGCFLVDLFYLGVAVCIERTLRTLQQWHIKDLHFSGLHVKIWPVLFILSVDYHLWERRLLFGVSDLYPVGLVFLGELHHLSSVPHNTHLRCGDRRLVRSGTSGSSGRISGRFLLGFQVTPYSNRHIVVVVNRSECLHSTCGMNFRGWRCSGEQKVVAAHIMALQMNRRKWNLMGHHCDRHNKNGLQQHL